MIEVQNLTKHYGDKKAVDDISFSVPDGEILGFLGPNGAGKSTTMNILTGYISSTSGKVIINGTDILENPSKAKSQIGYLPEMPPLYLDMTVKEYMNFIYDLKKCKLPRQSHLKRICNLVKINDVYNRVIKNLSKGYKQRVGLAQALVNDPPILILDEPTVGLDPTQIIEMRNLMKMLGEKHTIILSSHILSEIQAVCDKIIIINRGKVAANDTAESLSRTISESNILSAKIDGNKEEILKLIAGINGVKSVKCDTDCGKNVYDYSIETLDGADVRRELFSRLADRNSPLLGLKSSEMTLEDIFLKITMGEGIVINSTKKASTASPETAEKTEPSEEISDENSDAAENNSETNEGSDE